MTYKESLLSSTTRFLLFYYVDMAMDLAGEEELLDLEYKDKLQAVSQ